MKSVPRNLMVEHHKLVLNDDGHFPKNTSQGILLKSKTKAEHKPYTHRPGFRITKSRSDSLGLADVLSLAVDDKLPCCDVFSHTCDLLSLMSGCNVCFEATLKIVVHEKESEYNKYGSWVSQAGDIP